MGFHVLVLAGGSGTRLWPLSRQAVPKHLLPIGEGGKSLLRSTVERVLDIGDSVSIVTAGLHIDLCRQALEGLGLPDEALIAEPTARGTGPALGLATHLIARRDPDAVVASVHADHHVSDVEAYRDAVTAAAGWAAATGGLATVGIAPAYAATGFGYIELGDARTADAWRAPSGRTADRDDRARRLPAHASLGFREKPDRETAERFVEGGLHLLNLGLFAWPVRQFLEELRSADSELDDGLQQVIAAWEHGDQLSASGIYSALRSVPVEPLVFERTPGLTVVTASFSWSDLGSWSDLRESRAGAATPEGNILEGDALAVGSANCLVASRGGRLVAVVGAEGLVVVDTGDAVLVVPADRAQSVKDVVDRLKADGRTDLV